MKIRKFEKKDLRQVLDICREVRDYHIDILGGYFTPQDDRMEQEGFLASLINDKITVLVAAENDKIYGYLLASQKFAPYLQYPQVAHISNFGVKKEYRHQGLGKMLMDAFYDICRQKGIDEIRLGVFNKNQNAYNFYQDYGFEPFEQRMKINVKKEF